MNTALLRMALEDDTCQSKFKNKYKPFIWGGGWGENFWVYTWYGSLYGSEGSYRFSRYSSAHCKYQYQSVYYFRPKSRYGSKKYSKYHGDGKIKF